MVPLGWYEGGKGPLHIYETPEHQHKDTAIFFNTQVVYQLFYYYLCGVTTHKVGTEYTPTCPIVKVINRQCVSC